MKVLYYIENKNCYSNLMINVNNQISIAVSNNLELNCYFEKHYNLHDINKYDIRNVAKCIANIANDEEVDLIVFSATVLGQMIAPRVAALLDVGIVADITSFTYEEEFIFTRPAIGETINATIKFRDSSPQICSVRPNTFEYIPTNKNMIVKQYNGIKKFECVIKDVQVNHSSIDVVKQPVIISGGQGMGRNFHLLEEVASQINAVVCGSRKAVDNNQITRYFQVGQSGKILNSNIYIASGIRGANQHLEGIKHVKNVVAVNTDVNAPICFYAKLVIAIDANIFFSEYLKSKN